jgi:Acyl-CoA dehydrogenase N terminal
MLDYRAPLRDIRIVLHELLEAGKLNELPGYAEFKQAVRRSSTTRALSICPRLRTFR